MRRLKEVGGRSGKVWFVGNEEADGGGRGRAIR